MAVIDDFREAVIPGLRELVRTQAFFSAVGLIELEEARHAVNAAARKAGSGLLSQRDQDRLFEWIADLLWQEAEKAADRVTVLEARAAFAEKADPARYYDGLAGRCSKPEAMKLIFAAISPPYRKYLNGKRHNARSA